MATGPITAAGKARAALNGMTHGLTAQPKTLSRYEAFLKEHSGMKELWDEIPQDTDLSKEIGLARSRVAYFQKLKDEGKDFEVEQTNGRVRTYDIDDMLDRAMATLRSMTMAQNVMHPDASTKGDVRVTVTVEHTTANDAGDPDADLLALDADANAPVPEQEGPEEDAQHTEERGPLDELLEEEEP